jgi:murein DD-endopeptidase MepM/ murein hydrolase activator NlpD
MDNHWEVLLPGDPDWDITFAALPEEMLPVEHRPAPENVALDNLSVSTAMTDYYLPYAAGTKQWLEGSISHFQNIPDLGYPSCSEEYCRYAYDFTNTNHFPLLASKDGIVYASRDSCSDGNPTCTNYIVLKDSNIPTYQIYLHLSQYTIPDKLTNGTFVKRGQYIGDTDDTGYSTSNHVHFMVVDSIWAASGYYWGYSTDIRFADVPINGGIPRTCYEVTSFQIYDNATECIGDKSDPRNPNNDWFVSGNVGAYPPTGTLTRPVANATVASGVSPMIDVTATASDDVRVTGVQLVAKLNGQWVEIGPKVTQQVSPGTYDWDVNLHQ